MHVQGHIINIGSVAGAYPYGGGNVYGATKAFVDQFSLNLRADLHGKKVRVTNIAPGLVGGTEFSLVRFHGDGEKAKQPYANVEHLTPEDIAETYVRKQLYIFSQKYKLGFTGCPRCLRMSTSTNSRSCPPRSRLPASRCSARLQRSKQPCTFFFFPTLSLEHDAKVYRLILLFAGE